MADPIPKPTASPISPPSGGSQMGASAASATAAVSPSPSGSSAEPVIYTIPEKFYGAALRAKVMEVEKPSNAQQPADEGDKPKRAGWIIPVIIGVVLLAGVGGGFVYFNRNLLFPPKVMAPPQPEPPATPPPPSTPSAPTNLTATGTAPTVISLSWTDASDNEAGFRVERRESATSYAPVTTLPPNSAAWQDGGVQADTSYLYRIIAVNSAGDSTSSNEATAQTPPVPPPPPEQVKLPPAGLDTDSDGLTDLEEPLYGSPIRDPDADKDSFNDGNEVFHLYSPSGRAPGRLLESGLVKPFESPLGWRVYVPTTWQMKLDDDGMKGTILTGHGESFVISIEDNAEHKAILDWYLAKYPGVLSSQVVSVKTTGGFEGLEGADLLTTYFPWGDKVFVFHYDLDDQSFVNFRTTYEMMKNSLSLSAAPKLAGADTATAPPVTAADALAPLAPPVQQSAPDASASAPPSNEAAAPPQSTQTTQSSGTSASRDSRRLMDMQNVVQAFASAANDGSHLSGCLKPGDLLKSCVADGPSSMSLDFPLFHDPSGVADACTTKPTAPCNYSIRGATDQNAPPSFTDFRIDFFMEKGSGSVAGGAHYATKAGVQ